MPILFSSLATLMPGVPASTTNGLMPARPADLSTRRPDDDEAVRIRSSASAPSVQKIFVPFSTQSSPSRTAVVWIAEVSEPQPGSVIAIAAHFGLPSRKPPRRRSFCSRVPAAATAAPPRPLPGRSR